MNAPATSSVPAETEISNQAFRQVISTGYDSLTVAPGDVIQMPVRYHTTDQHGHAAQLQSNVFDFNLHFDSTQLEFLGFTRESEFLEGRIAAGSEQDESQVNGDDGDESTSRVVRTSFSSIGGFQGGMWPSQPSVEPLTLYVAQFRVLPGFSGGTRINFSANGTPVVYKQPAEFEFTGQSLTLIGDSEPDSDAIDSIPGGDGNSAVAPSTPPGDSGDADSANPPNGGSSQTEVVSPPVDNHGNDSTSEPGNVNSDEDVSLGEPEESPSTIPGPIDDAGQTEPGSDSDALTRDDPSGSTSDASLRQEVAAPVVENTENGDTAAGKRGGPSLSDVAEDRDVAEKAPSAEQTIPSGGGGKLSEGGNLTPAAGSETPPIHELLVPQIPHADDRPDLGRVPLIIDAIIPEDRMWNPDEELPVTIGGPTAETPISLTIKPNVSPNDASVGSFNNTPNSTAENSARSIRVRSRQTEATAVQRGYANNDASPRRAEEGWSHSVGAGEFIREGMASTEGEDAVHPMVVGQIDEVFSEFAHVLRDWA